MERKTPSLKHLYLFLVVMALLHYGMLVMAAGAPEQNIAQGIANLSDEDWKRIAAVLFFPSLIGCTFTVIVVTVWRRGQAQRRRVVYSDQILWVSVKAGAVFGPVCQGLYQSYEFFILGVAFAGVALWLLFGSVAASVILTGVASLLWYEVLRWFTEKTGMKRLAAFLSVKSYNPKTKEVVHDEFTEYGTIHKNRRDAFRDEEDIWSEQERKAYQQRQNADTEILEPDETKPSAHD